MKNRFAWLALMTLLATGSLFAQSSAQTAPQGQTPGKADPWAGVRFLIGSWEAKTTGGMAKAQASGSYDFRMELNGHVMARHSRSGACSAPNDFNCQHSDLLYIYPTGDGGSIKAIYFDNEGHVIHYDVSTPRLGKAVFLSDTAQPGPQFRLSYELLDGVMSGKFELKIQGQAEFSSYLEWSGRRQ